MWSDLFSVSSHMFFLFSFGFEWISFPLISFGFCLKSLFFTMAKLCIQSMWRWRSGPALPAGDDSHYVRVRGDKQGCRELGLRGDGGCQGVGWEGDKNLRGDLKPDGRWGGPAACRKTNGSPPFFPLSLFLFSFFKRWMVSKWDLEEMRSICWSRWGASDGRPPLSDVR